MPHFLDIKDCHRLVDPAWSDRKNDAAAIEKARVLAIGVSLDKPAVDPMRRISVLEVVNVAGWIISKVAAREGAIISLGLVEYRDMWRDALLLDQPVQHRSRPVSGIADKPLRLETKALLG